MRLKDYKETREALEDPIVYSNIVDNSISKYTLKRVCKDSWMLVAAMAIFFGIMVYAKYKSTGEISGDMICTGVAACCIAYWFKYIVTILKEIVIMLDISLHIQRNVKRGKSWEDDD